MTQTLFMARASVRTGDDHALAALAAVLVPKGDAGERLGVAHRLIWTLFADGADRRRDFLWREEAPGRFLILSHREPVDRHALFDLDCKPFEAALAVGDRLHFALRANATIDRARPLNTLKQRLGSRQRHDVVMHYLHQHSAPGPNRAGEREHAITTAGRAWLDAQGTRRGFRLLDTPSLLIDGYDTRSIPRPKAEPLRFGVLDFAGMLQVTDPAMFQTAIATGLGRARGFGCGLLLIRRA